MAELSIRSTLGKQIVHRARSYADHGVELRSAPDGTGGEKLTFRGYASVYNHDYPISDPIGTYVERMIPGCFSRCLSEGADVPFKINHGGMTLARTKAGSMTLDANDPYGLLVEARLDPRIPEVRSLQILMEGGEIDEMSFSFSTYPDGNRWYMQGNTERCDRVAVNIHKGDVSAVNYGANPATAGAYMRSADFVAHPELLTDEDQRLMYERLAAKFTPKPSATAMSTAEIRALAST